VVVNTRPTLEREKEDKQACQLVCGFFFFLQANGVVGSGGLTLVFFF